MKFQANCLKYIYSNGMRRRFRWVAGTWSYFSLFPQLLRVVTQSTWYFSLNYFWISSGYFLNYFVFSPQVHGIFPGLLPVVCSTTWGLFANYFRTYLANFPELLPAASRSSYPNNYLMLFYELHRGFTLWYDVRCNYEIFPYNWILQIISDVCAMHGLKGLTKAKFLNNVIHD